MTYVPLEFGRRNVGSNVSLTCASEIYPGWQGPDAKGSFLVYNYPGSPKFNPNLGEKFNRLYWESDKILVIRNVVRNDSGIYTCRSQMIYMNMSLTVRVQPYAVDIPDAITSSDRLIIQGTEGVAMKLTCTSFGGYPVQAMYWYKSSVSTQPLYSIEAERVHDQTSNTFNITQITAITPTRQDDGVEYICQSSFSDEPRLIVAKSATLFLNLKPSPPKITTTDNLKEGENKPIANCQTTGFRPSESLNITWIYRGISTLYTGTTLVDNNGTFSGSVYYSKLTTREDNGQVLTCSVSHQTLAALINASVTMQIKFKPLFANITGNNAIVANGVNKLMLTCTTGTSNPVSSMSWKVNGINKPSNETSTNISGDYGGTRTQQTLILWPVRENDGDLITCESKNEISQGITVMDNVVIDLIYRPLINTLTNVTVVEGNGTHLECSASSKPPSTFRWYKEGQSQILYQGTGTLSNNKVVYTINRVSRAHASTYRCYAENGIETSDEKALVLSVLYPPDVTVALTNTSVKANTTTLNCVAKGVPDTGYKYGKWVQVWPGYGVISERSGSHTLVLSSLTYEYTGIYTCSVSNSIKLFASEREYMEGSAYLLVKSSPVITQPDISMSRTTVIPGKLKNFASTIVEFYTNVETVGVECYRSVNDIQQFENVCTTNFEDIMVSLPVYSHIIPTPGKKVNISIRIATALDFGEYDVKITNTEGSSFLKLKIVGQGPPEVPLDIKLEEIYQKAVKLSWRPGFHGGLDQTVVIQISTDEDIWTNITHIFNGKNATETTFTLEDLIPAKRYSLRLYAFNKEGRSNFTEIVKFSTHPTCDAADVGRSDSSLIVGTVLGAVIVGLVACLILLIIRMRRQRLKQAGSVSSGTGANKKDRPIYENVAFDEASAGKEEKLSRSVKMNTKSEVDQQYSTLDLHLTDDNRAYDVLNTVQ